LEIDGAFPCTSADIQRITCCCPALRKLHIRTHPSKESCTQLSALASLSSLTSLSITGVNDSMAPSLAQLSCLGKLQDLIIGDIFAYPRPEHLQDAGLQELTVLTQLTSLKFSAACLTPERFNKMVAKGFKKEHSASGHFGFTMRTKVGILTTSRCCGSLLEDLCCAGWWAAWSSSAVDAVPNLEDSNSSVQQLVLVLHGGCTDCISSLPVRLCSTTQWSVAGC
jgi:hypothetical protein